MYAGDRHRVPVPHLSDLGGFRLLEGLLRAAVGGWVPVRPHEPRQGDYARIIYQMTGPLHTRRVDHGSHGSEDPLRKDVQNPLLQGNFCHLGML